MKPSDDFLDQLGELALGSRLKRLSDRFSSDIANLYQEMGLVLQPRWFPLLALLRDTEACSIVEAAEKLGISQPAISQMSQQLLKAEIVTSSPGKTDSRRRVLKLTEKGKKQIELATPVWEAVSLAAKELCKSFGNDFYESLLRCERANNEQSLRERTHLYLENQTVKKEEIHD